MPTIKQVHTRHVERHASGAIARRIGCTTNAILSVKRDSSHPDSVILHVNSAGNAREAEQELRYRGYRVSPTDYNPFAPGNYGVQLRVGPKQQPAQSNEQNRYPRPMKPSAQSANWEQRHTSHLGVPSHDIGYRKLKGS